MSGRSWRIFDALSARLNKSPVLSNAIENATERAHVQMINIQNIATKKYDTIVKQVHGATLIQDLKSAALEPSTPIPKYLVNWWKWYQQLTGLEDIEVAKRQMIAVQDKLFDCQDRRRELTNEASIVADKLKQVYGELVQTRREDSKYVQLTIIENKGLQEQGKIMSQLKLLEHEERDYFTQLATTIKEYHDSQTMNAQKYKYLSILASAVIAILSLGGSMVYNNKRIADVHKIIAAGQERNETIFKNYFGSLDNNINEIKNRKYPTPIIAHTNVESSTDKLSPSLYQDKKIVIGALALLFFLLSRLSS